MSMTQTKTLMGESAAYGGLGGRRRRIDNHRTSNARAGMSLG
jgi:hypothetical protein